MNSASSAETELSLSSLAAGALNVRVRAKYAAITWQRLEHGAAVLAFKKE